MVFSLGQGTIFYIFGLKDKNFKNQGIPLIATGFQQKESAFIMMCCTVKTLQEKP